VLSQSPFVSVCFLPEGGSRELQACQTEVRGKVVEQIILSAITWHVRDNQTIRPGQQDFMKGRSCLTNLISYDKKEIING